MNAEDLLLLVNKYVCGMPKKRKKAPHPVLLLVTVAFRCVSWSLILMVAGAVVRFPLGPGFCCRALGEGHWEWLVEADVGWQW